MPGVVIGISTVLFWDRVASGAGAGYGSALYDGLFLTTMGQSCFIASYCMLVFVARLQRFDYQLIDAALDLGATNAQAFRKILLPFLRPAIASAAIIAFLASFENYNTSVFTLSHYTSFTVEVAQKVRLGIDPSISALAVIVISLTLFAAIAREAYAPRGPAAGGRPVRRLRGRPARQPAGDPRRVPAGRHRRGSGVRRPARPGRMQGGCAPAAARAAAAVRGAGPPAPAPPATVPERAPARRPRRTARTPARARSATSSRPATFSGPRRPTARPCPAPPSAAPNPPGGLVRGHLHAGHPAADTRRAATDHASRTPGSKARHVEQARPGPGGPGQRREVDVGRAQEVAALQADVAQLPVA